MTSRSSHASSRAASQGPCLKHLACGWLVGALALAWAGAVCAQDSCNVLESQATDPSIHADERAEAERLLREHCGSLIGRSTQDLLARQRVAPGQRPRPIEGEQASRSYGRYLKSFETSIPEHYSTGLDVKQ